MSKQKVQEAVTSTPTVPSAPVAGTQELIVEPAVLRDDMSLIARRIGSASQRYSLGISQLADDVERAFLMAQAIDELRSLLAVDAMKVIMSLMNTHLGFMTDKCPPRDPPYSVEVVRECFIASLLEGFRPWGNEWNIIAGRMFGAKNGWRRKLNDVPGISDVKIVSGSVQWAGGKASVRVVLAWRLHGVADALPSHDDRPGRQFSVHTYGKEKDDAIIGKAEARAYRAAYLQATGSVCTLSEDEVDVPALAVQTPSLPAGDTQALVDRRQESSRRELASQEARDEIRAAAQDMGLKLPEWKAVCTACGVPDDARDFSPADAARVLDYLRGVEDGRHGLGDAPAAVDAVERV